jgi:hypothetical protein
MTNFEKKFTGAFRDRFDGGANVMRLRSVSVYPEFDSALPDEKESYLEAAESLERKGLISLNWEKRGKGERLKTLTCPDIKKLFESAGRKNPGNEAEEIRAMIKAEIPLLEKKYPAEKTLLFLRYLADNFSPADARRGMDSTAAADFMRLTKIFLEPEKWVNMTTRALSVQLYRDSKRFEYLLDFVFPFAAQAEKQGVPVPDFSLLRRSFPEASLSGKIIFEFAHDENEQDQLPPMINSGGLIISLPLASVTKISNIKTILPKENPSVLTIENKETFYALAALENCSYDCCLYTNGYPNRAAAAMIRLLAASGFSFFHAGDLDPDGILILQNIREIAEKPVAPVRMDAVTFDRYLTWARPLNKIMLGQTLKISDETREIPGLTGLIKRIEETGCGIEQEIIDYQ